MVTYADLQTIARNEKNFPTLQHVGKDFYTDASKLLTEVEEKYREHVAKLIDDIYERRQNKIVLHALRTKDTDAPPANITSVEKKFYILLIEILKKSRDDVFEKTEEQKPAEKVEESIPDGYEKVRVLHELPAIIGVDSKHYGPFKEGDVVLLLEVNAKILVEKGMAEEI